MQQDRRRTARPSKRTFLIRRLVVAGTLAAFVLGAVLVIRMVATTEDADAPSETTAVAGADTGPVGPLDSTTIPPTTEPPPTDPPVPSASDPARVLLVGDSQAQGLEPFLRTVLDLDGITTLTTDGRNSTGLVRADAFDWPARLRDTVPTEDPDIVVAFFGGNDGQSFIDMPTKPVDSAEWRAEYGRRVGEVMDFLSADGRTLIWIGVPIPGDASLRSRLTVQNEVVNEQLATRPDVIFIDSWWLFAGIDGNYAPLVLDPLTGTYLGVRAERDQFHLNTPGTKILAAAVGHAISEELTRRGALEAGSATPTTIDLTAPGTYTIAAGDTLIGIANRTGTTVDAIVAANGWSDSTQVVHVGQGIQLPAKSA